MNESRDILHEPNGFLFSGDTESEVGIDASKGMGTDLSNGSIDTMKHSRYGVLQHIGEGGMGVVVLARDRYLQRDLAMKVISLDKSADPAFVDRFIEEAQIAGQLQHPSIVPIHDIGKLEDDRPFFTMKLIRGETLEVLLKKRASLAEEMPKWIGIFVQVCQAVAFAHAKNVIHRDLKPSNVMIGRFGEVQVMDWGLAKILPSAANLPTAAEPTVASNADTADLGMHGSPPVLGPPPQQTTMESIIQSIRYSPNDANSDTSISQEREEHTSSLTSQGFILGTLGFMPPEQATGSADNLTTRSDVFALGALLCQIMTGKPPYVADSKVDLHQLAIHGNTADAQMRLSQSPYDQELQHLVLRCLSKDPHDRPNDASVLVDFIAQHTAMNVERLRSAELERTATEAKYEATQRAILADQQRRRWVWGAGTATLLLALSLTVSYFWIRQTESVLLLARSNATIAELKEAQERTNRLADARRTAQQITIPLENTLAELHSSSERPIKASFLKLELDLQRATQLMADSTDFDSQRMLVTLGSRLRWMRQLAESLDQIEAPLTEDALVALLLGHATNAQTTRPITANLPDPESIQHALNPLPTWGKKELTIAILNSIYRFGGLPDTLESLLDVNPFEKSMWQAIKAGDLSQLRSLAQSSETQQQSLTTLLVLSQTLLNEGPAWETSLALKELEWVVIQPDLARYGNRLLKIAVSKEGWIEVPSSESAGLCHVEADLPDENIRFFRLETYCGTEQSVRDYAIAALSDQTTDNQNTTQKDIRDHQQNSISAATSFEPDRRALTMVGPGVVGLGPEFCLISELNLFRAIPGEKRIPLKLERYFSEHITASGRPVDAAFDQNDTTYWAIGHANDVPIASTIFETQSLSAVDAQGRLELDLYSGDDDLWKPTYLGRFRLSYAKPSGQPKESSVLIAQKLLDQLERRFPANPEILNQLARSRVESGVLAEINREAATVLASTALTIEPDNRTSLLFFTEMVLAGQTRFENAWYPRLLNLLESITDPSLKQPSEERIARYQSDRGDRLHVLHPGTAFEAYIESERLAPDLFQRHGRLAHGYFRKGELEKAMQIARRGVGSETIDTENLFYYGTVAVSYQAAQEAFPVFQRWFERDPARKQIDKLLLLYARICFSANQMQTGKDLLLDIQSKVGLSPSVITTAAICTVTSSKPEELVWLLDFWGQHDPPELTQSLYEPIFRTRRTAWGMVAMAAIALDQSPILEQALRTKLATHPIILDEVFRIVDALVLDRGQPLASFVNMDHSLQLISLFRKIQPDEPRWVVRHALLQFLHGDTTEPLAMLESLPIQNTGSDAIVNPNEGRHWSNMARVVIATIRIVEAARDARHQNGQPNLEMQERAIADAQQCLGRVPEPDRDLAEWLWWEYRIDQMKP